MDPICDSSQQISAAEPLPAEEETASLPCDGAEEAPADTALEDCSESTEELKTLRKEVESLRLALAEKEREQQAALREIGEFHRLFPDIPISDVPDGVWDSVERGIPLSAAYALYEKKRQAAQGRAEEINRRNASLSAGKAGKHTAGDYFSPDEVRAMSQRQVHENYRAIMDSMRHWH